MKQRLTIFCAFVFLVVACQQEPETPPGTTMYDPGPLPELFIGFPAPEDNPTTDQGVALGRMLFYEKRLSANNTMSCGTCHQQKFAFSDGGNAVSSGLTGAVGTRNTMALINLAWRKNFNWDGSANSLEEQAHIPLESTIEMHQNLSRSVNKLQNTSTYPPLFLKAFGSSVITEENIQKAIGQFERTLISSNSKFDQEERGTAMLDPDELAGKRLFFMTHPEEMPGIPLPPNKRTANCFDCHGGKEFYTRDLIVNNGLDNTFADPGLGKVTGNPKDNGRFKAPTLRNIALTGPYMHDGRFKTLDEVMNHYNNEVKKGSPGIHPEMLVSNTGNAHDQLGLTPKEISQVIAFLHTLTDTTFINDPRFSDPFKDGKLAK